jgi:hypothetical protein
MQQLNFIRAYIAKQKEIDEKNMLNNPIIDEKLLQREANYFALVSSIFWIAWSIYQASTSTAKFDYLVRKFFLSNVSFIITLLLIIKFNEGICTCKM